jgi:hypothetical protein
MSETGISTRRRTSEPKEDKQVGDITIWKRGKNVIVVCLVSASGNYFPVTLIFSGKEMPPDLKMSNVDGAPYSCFQNWWNVVFSWLPSF